MSFVMGTLCHGEIEQLPPPPSKPPSLQANLPGDYTGAENRAARSLLPASAKDHAAQKPSAIISYQQHWSRQISQQPTLP